MTRRPAKRPSDEGLHLHLINGETLHFRRFECSRAMLHRYMVAVYILMWLGLTLADPSGQSGSPPLGVRLPQYGVGVLTVAVALMAIYSACDLFLGGKGRVVSLPVSPVVLAVSLLGLSASEATVYFLEQTPRITPKIFAVLTVFYFVIIEILLQLVVWLLLPRILADLRHEPGAQTPHATTGQAYLRVGAHDLPPETVLHIEAQGNYVSIVTDTTRYEVPGPFSAILAQMPQGIGLRIHRSHWVARRAVVGHRRKGRELVCDLSYGGEATVALPRQAEVLDWLARTAAMDAPDQPRQASAATHP